MEKLPMRTLEKSQESLCYLKFRNCDVKHNAHTKTNSADTKAPWSHHKALLLEIDTFMFTNFF